MAGALNLESHSHEEEASPLHTNLCYAQQSSGARKGPDLFTAGHIAGAFGQRKDVCDACRARHGTQQHKHGTETAGGAPRDDLVMLWQVRYEDAYDYEAIQRQRSAYKWI